MRSGKALATLGINQVVILFVTMVTRQRLTPVTVRLLQLVSKQTCCTFTRNTFFFLKTEVLFFPSVWKSTYHRENSSTDL